MDKEKEKIKWKEKLTKGQYKVLIERGTELPFIGKLLHNKESGMYVCAACGNKLFSSKTKFDSGTGWPSFYDAANSESVELKDDFNLGVHRIEVACKKCGGHLGHVFDDGPREKTGKRYCINSCALDFVKKKV